MCGRCFGSVLLKLSLSKCVLVCCKGHYRPVANSMNRLSRPAIDCWLERSPRKFSTTMLKVDVCEFVITGNWIAVLAAKNPVFAFDGIKAWWKMGLVAF